MGRKKEKGIVASAKDSLEPDLLSEACHWDGFTGKQEWQEFMGLLLLGDGYPSCEGGFHSSRYFGIIC